MKAFSILEAASISTYIIHHGNEPGYSFLEEGEVSIEISSPEGKSKIYLDTEGDMYTVCFADAHEHFDTTEEEEYHLLIQDIIDIMNNKRCSGAIFYNEGNGELHWCASRFLRADKGMNRSLKEVFSIVYELNEFREKLERHGGEVHYRFWDSSLDKNIIIPPN